MFERILVCLDGSSLAEQILPYATEVAQRFASRMILLQVIPPSSVLGGGDTTLELELFGPAKAYLERIAQPLREVGLDVECATLLEPPGQAIISYANKSGVGLIAIATHGRGGLGRVMFGSVADFVLRESRLPVLMVRPQDTKA